MAILLGKRIKKCPTSFITIPVCASIWFKIILRYFFRYIPTMVLNRHKKNTIKKYEWYLPLISTDCLKWYGEAGIKIIKMKVKAQNLAIGYPEKSILQNIDFEVSAGDFVVVLGKNGSGKSTLLKTLSGILPKLSGDIYLEQENIDKIKQLNKYIGIVLTDKIEVPLSVYEILRLGRQAFTDAFDRLQDSDRIAIEELAKSLSIKHLLNRKIYELSDGERQKVMLGRALAQETPILLLDEPTTHLDLENKAILLKLLKKMSQEQNKIIIFSTHDINLVLALSPKIWLINDQQFRVIDLKKQNQEEIFQIFDSQHIIYDENNRQFRVNFE